MKIMLPCESANMQGSENMQESAAMQESEKKKESIHTQLSKVYVSENREAGEAVCNNCDTLGQASTDRNDDSFNDASLKCLCKNYVQFFRTTGNNDCPRREGRVSFRAPINCNSALVMEETAQPKDNVLLNLAQFVNLLFTTILTFISPRAIRAHSSSSIPQTALTLLLLTCAFTGCLASAGGADDVKAPFSPCSRVSKTTTRQVYSRHPSNCSVFYMCYGNQHWELSCTQNNTIFSLLHSVCVWKGSKYDDCSLPVARLTTAYAWNKVPFLGADGRRKFGKDIQHKTIDVVIPSVNQDEKVHVEVEATTSLPSIDQTSGEDSGNISTPTSDKTLQNIQMSFVVSKPTHGMTSESVSDKPSHEKISQSANNETSHETITEENYHETTDKETSGEKRKDTPSNNVFGQPTKFMKQRRPLDQVFRGYSIQFPTFRAGRTESRTPALTPQTEGKLKGEDTPLTADSPKRDSTDEAAEVWKNVLKDVSKPESNGQNTEDVEVESIKLSTTNYSGGESFLTQDTNLAVGLPIEYNIDTTETNTSLTSSTGDDDLGIKNNESEITRTEIDRPNFRLNVHNVDGSSTAEDVIVVATASSDFPNKERDSVEPDNLKYRDTYIRDRWPMFDVYGTAEQRTTTGSSLLKNTELSTQTIEAADIESSVISYQTGNPVDESDDDMHIQLSLLEGRELKIKSPSNQIGVPEFQRHLGDYMNKLSEDRLKKRAGPSWLFSGALSDSWLHAKRQMLTPAPGFQTDLMNGKLQRSEVQDGQLLGATNEPFKLKTRFQEMVRGSQGDAHASTEHRFWYDKLPVGTSRGRALPANNNTDLHPFEGFKQAIPTLSVYKRQNTGEGKNLTNVKHARDDNTKTNAADILSADILSLSGDVDNRLPFGRPWSRLYPRRVESSIFRSTLRPTRRPAFPVGRKATDNPKLMEQFLRLLNISKSHPKSEDLSADRKTRLFKEKAKQVKLTDKRTTVSPLLTRKITPSPRKPLPITPRPQSMTTKKKAFSFTAPPLTNPSKNLNQIRASPPTKAAWLKDRYVDLLDKTTKTKPTTKSVIPNVNKWQLTTKQSRLIPPYKLVPTTQKSISAPRITIQKPKGIPKYISKDKSFPTISPSPRVRPTSLPPLTTRPLTSRRPPTVNVTPTLRVTDSKLNRPIVPKGNLQQYPVTIKESQIRSKADLQKLKERHIQALQNSDKQSRFTPKLPQNLLTPWYPTSFQVFYQVYPFVNLNNKNNDKNIEKSQNKNLPKPTVSLIEHRTTKSSDYLTFKRINPFTPPPLKQQNLDYLNPKSLQTRPTNDGMKYTNARTRQDTGFKTQAPQISQKKLEILRKMAPQIWNRLIADSRRREVPPKVVIAETTTMQVYVKPTHFGRQNEVDVQGSYWWDRNTQGPKYVVPTSPAFTTSTVTESTTTQAPATTTTQTTWPTTSSTTTTTTTTTTSTPSTTAMTSTTASTTPEPTSLMVTTTDIDFKAKKLPPFVGPDYIPDYRKEMQDRCGIMGRPLIVGGRKSRSGQWPWQVSLQIITSTTPWHRCGGVLVHARWVLTAAHCVEGSFYGDIRNWRVVLADYDLDTISGNEIYRDVVRIISHPDYVRTSNFPNDIALLELDTPVDLTSGDVQTACLPDINMPLGAGTKCWISGWGETRGSGGNENMMNEVPVDVVSNDDCRAMWGKVNIDVLETQVCLGYGDTGACYGDSGGPLMCEDQGRFYVAGVMSWLINNCSATNFPNVFTRLPNYMDWVYEHLDYFEWLRYL
ncbi:hypothetical protein Btru_013515 [Bulinus truncatus]|nr:hypothetical protein Btru_013515 [Bulinus truncatus]